MKRLKHSFFGSLALLLAVAGCMALTQSNQGDQREIEWAFKELDRWTDLYQAVAQRQTSEYNRAVARAARSLDHLTDEEIRQHLLATMDELAEADRSEERRVGKECRSRRSRQAEMKKRRGRVERLG